ncbi:50S ribosomal protein L28 [Candidatus Nardonella dryophthoridicola]|uniref:Large ribosomal subunit protein bL28 n=1 Tax=endosymbiont of Rhynchophorus ferrugineus TaxID=1972133 RepID=A0A2Z5T3Q3_9GAMM|nr:50S ribosomal protein L28 [Candidatus Nardonella dryophthoridicola]QTJ62788.1 50S ribosomal protein L28 [Candidatus Nardonella dryophthoridicola]BBA85031.1 50S ribosomal protein L28 [endosymbiont of Rhynchophorus ferrugineus]
MNKKLCKITNRKNIIGFKRSHAMNKSKRKFKINIKKKKKIWLYDEKKFIKINISTKGIKIINKNNK